MRALAVMGVILWHAGLSVQGRLLLPGGFLGVDVFFVISGYLMARIWHGGITLSDFAKRRLRRILPMLFVTILVCIPFAFWLMGRTAQNEFGADAIASTLLVPNIFYSFQDSYWSAPAKLRPLLHLWTIGVEIQFYLLCPIIFLAVKKWKKPLLTLGTISVISFAAAVIFSQSYPQISFYNLPMRLWEFGVGALIFYAPLDKLRSGLTVIIGLSLIFLSFIFFTDAITHPSWATLIPVLGTCLVITRGGTTTPILTNSLIRRIGVISFSVYLIHQPLFAFTRIATQQIELSAPIALGLILLTLLLSDLTYRFIETPLRKKGSKRGQVILILGVLSLSLSGALHFKSQINWNSEALLTKPERWILETDGTFCVNRSIDHPCRLGGSEASPMIALLGDSHMQAMGGGFDEYFSARGVNDIDYSMGGCPFIMGVRRYARKYACDQFVEDIFTQLKVQNIKTVVILDRRNAYLLGTGAIYDDGTRELSDLRLYPVTMGPDSDAAKEKREVERLHIETLERLRSLGIKIVVIYPVPEIGIHVPDTLLMRVENGNLPLTLNRKLHAKRQLPLVDLKAFVAEDDEVFGIDPADIFCTTLVCAVHDDSQIYYTDRDHPSRAGSEKIIKIVGPVIMNTLLEKDTPNK